MDRRCVRRGGSDAGARGDLALQRPGGDESVAGRGRGSSGRRGGGGGRNSAGGGVEGRRVERARIADLGVGWGGLEQSGGDGGSRADAAFGRSAAAAGPQRPRGGHGGPVSVVAGFDGGRACDRSVGGRRGRGDGGGGPGGARAQRRGGGGGVVQAAGRNAWSVQGGVE